VRRALTIWLPLFALYAATLGIDAAPGERLAPDEARFLAAAEQLADGGGLDRGPQGIGFPMLLAPLHALGGATLCAIALAAIAALAFTLGAALARRIVPDPWATWAALATGASPVVLGHATVVVPALLAGALLAGACLCALRMRERPLMRDAFSGAAMLALLPWLDPWLLVPALPVAVLLARWTARRGRSMVALGTAEIQLASLVFYVSLNERLYSGVSPLASLDGPVTGAATVGQHAERIPRLALLFADPGSGLLRWAPVVVLAFAGVWLLWRSRHERLGRIVADQRDAEHAAFLALAVCAAQVLVAAFTAPSLEGAWFPGRQLAPALPCSVALIAWGWRRLPRAGAALAALTVATSAWVLLAGDGWTTY
jgi:hypothetical protein